MTPTRPACVVLLLATLAALAPGLDVEMRPTTIKGWFFHPEVGMMYVPLPGNMQQAHIVGIGGSSTFTIWFNSAGVVDTMWPRPEQVGRQLPIEQAWSDDLSTASLAWSGSQWPLNGVRADVTLSAELYVRDRRARPDEILPNGPHRRALPATLAERGFPACPMVLEIVRVRALTSNHRDFPTRLIPSDFGAEMTQGVDPSLWCIPRVCVVRMPTITVTQDQAAAAGFVGEGSMSVSVRFNEAGRADGVELYLPSGSAALDTLLTATARKARLSRNPGISFASPPTIEMHYQATVLPLLDNPRGPAFRGWLEPDALQLVATE